MGGAAPPDIITSVNFVGIREANASNQRSPQTQMAEAPSLVTTPLLPTASWTETRPSVAGFRLDVLRHDGVNMMR